MNFVRWICVLPGAIGAALLGHFIFQSMLRLSMYVMWIDSSALLTRLMIELTSGGVLGACFILAGIRIAPERKFETTLALVTIGLLSLGFFFAFNFIAPNFNWWALTNLIGICIGIIQVSTPIFKDYYSGQRAEEFRI